MGEQGGGHGCHGDLLKDVSTLVYLWAGRACTAGPLTEQMCVRTFVCACVYQHVGEDAHVQTDSKTHKLTLPQLSL